MSLWVDTVEKVFWGGERNFPEPLMRFVRNDVETTSFLRKTTTDFRIGAMQHPSGGLVQKSTFARFLEFFDFRLFQQYRSSSDTGLRRRIALERRPKTL
jgi:hypothetical protein